MNVLTARQASERLGMTPNAVSMWASRGWINDAGERQHLTVIARTRQGAWFSWNELVIAERDTRRKRNRSHRRTRHTACIQ